MKLRACSVFIHILNLTLSLHDIINNTFIGYCMLMAIVKNIISSTIIKTKLQSVQVISRIS